ncbi:DUF3304 domain-containing protein [Achromobacter xylosoxidans]|nr:DUF3304 domain-containing protein [Achromobacter xylosoxidans]
MRKSLVFILIWLGLLAGCNGEPTYQGVTLVAFNYTPWDLDSVQLTDGDGRSASSGAIGVGGGEGSGTCCYTLKGTEFVVKWSGTDGEEAIKHLYDGKLDEVVFRKETKVHFPSAKIPSGDGPLYLELHIYPDEHMEIALSRKLLGQTRLPLVAVTDWLYSKHRDALQGYRDGYEVLRTVGKVAKTAWIKYRIEEKRDMEQYMLLHFTVSPNFDRDPVVAAILAKSDRRPGDFANAVEAMSGEDIARLKATGAASGEKNG